jgi:hypothetical protein
MKKNSIPSFTIRTFAIAAAATVIGCGAQNQGTTDATANTAEELTATIGVAGGELTGAGGSSFEGVHIVIPPGALSADTHIRVTRPTDDPALPATARACGPTYAFEPAGLALLNAATITLPFDENVVQDSQRFDDEVKVWVRDGDHWSRTKQTDSAEGSVTITLSLFTHVAAGVNPARPEDILRFPLVPNPKFVKCLAAYPDDPRRAPQAQVVVVRGELNDSLSLRAINVKPGLKFDMFTVEHSPLAADGAPIADFSGFGLAWYQSDLDARNDGTVHANIRTILLDQIFGFDPAAALAPTGTFHVGFWFNDPNDAAACGFNPAAPTPFNGDHKAGPLAMISLPDTTTNLGPLCTNPDTSVTPARCSP